MRPTGELLELGSGDGAMAAAISQNFPDLQLMVTDIDPAMVRAARQRFRDHDRVSVSEADVTDLPFADGRFAVVASFLMLHHVIAWQDALSEARRVLQPGGTFVGYDLHRSRIADLIHVVDRSPYRLIEPDDFGAGLEAAGFDRVRISKGLGGFVTKFVAEVAN